MIFDQTVCELGEGLLWHPERQALIWFDITGQKMFVREGADLKVWDLEEMCSAAGWVDRDNLLVASETALGVFHLDEGTWTHVTVLEAENSLTRSNDGRADPWGGFWIGTMGKKAEHRAGAIYRYSDGQLKKLYGGVTIPNAICFDGAAQCAYFTDTPTGVIRRVHVNEDGWPDTPTEVFADFKNAGLSPDGAVVLADGTLLVACWGAGGVVPVTPDGVIGTLIPAPAPHVTCPAMGGPMLTDLYCTSATEGMTSEALASYTDAGKTFQLEGIGTGLAEPRVRLDAGDWG
jgi:sugar lactone lactonase YvrE